MPKPTPYKVVRLRSRFKAVAKLDERALAQLPAANMNEAEIAGGKHTVEFWAQKKQVSPVWFHAAKTGNRWPNLFEATEEEFEAAIAATQSIRIA